MSCFNKCTECNILAPAFVLLFILVTSLLSTASFAAALNNNLMKGSNIAGSSHTATLLNPNPQLIDKDGNLIQNFNLSSNLTRSIGTIADGVSKLIIEVAHKHPLAFSIVGTNPKNLTDGTLLPLITNPGIEKPLSSIVVSPHPTKNGSLVVAAVYTPPDFINEPTAAYKNITVSINDPENSSVSFSPTVIRLYHPPVVLVHGLWENPTVWTQGNFKQKLANAHFDVIPADYSKYNATTFDPYANKTFGNYGINATKYAIHFALNKLHNQSIAAAQADVIAHSVGGLIARGFVQQPDYNSSTNYMKGYIHRLITIGTPHFGGQLAEPLYSHLNDRYCYVPATKVIIFPAGCQFDPIDFELMQLKAIYKNELHAPVDAGGVEALIPGSIAYSHLCQTNVKSYAIVGSWGPNAVASHFLMESLFKNLLGDPTFNLDIDGFRGNFQGDNDLQVNLTSQAGGLHTVFPISNNPKHDALPNESKGYNNTVHSSIFIAPPDQSLVQGELSSIQIQNDVSKLLNSDDGKFADSIGIGVPCDIPK
jgi:pimeloyl-ACP methyl ester carboxylesterase